MRTSVEELFGEFSEVIGDWSFFMEASSVSELLCCLLFSNGQVSSTAHVFNVSSFEIDLVGEEEEAINLGEFVIDLFFKLHDVILLDFNV